MFMFVTRASGIYLLRKACDAWKTNLCTHRSQLLGVVVIRLIMSTPASADTCQMLALLAGTALRALPRQDM